MSSIDSMGGAANSQGVGGDRSAKEAATEESSDDDGGFRSALSRAASSTASGVSRVADKVPGGEPISAAAGGVERLTGGSSGEEQQLEEMFEMQQDSQAFNTQYLEMQNALQEEDRKFSTLSNLMKARHDTAKSAINNMHV